MSGPDGMDVIVFPIMEWEFRFQRPQHLARRLARHGYRVFYLRTRFTAGLEIREPESRIYQVGLPGPGRLSIYRDRMDDPIVAQVLPGLDALRRQHDLGFAICLIQSPFWTPLAMRARNSFGWKAVYDCLDHHSGFSEAKPEALVDEDRLFRESDLVLATSRFLLRKARRHASRSVLLPNGADVEHFEALLGPTRPLAGERPIVGFYGAIAEWFDVDLVAEMAELRPQWTFILVGNAAGADVTRLRQLPNVHLYGEQPYDTLPAFLHQFDVCLMPFRMDHPLTRAMNPVEFYEYLSAGKPVVATPMAEISAHAKQGFVYLAEDGAAAVAEVERALAKDSPALAAARRTFASANSWEARFRVLDRELRELFPKASIIVPTCNNGHLTHRCLERIFRCTDYPRFEVIVVDNGSSDGTQDHLLRAARTRDNLRVILNDANRGFAAAINQGAAAATGDYIVFLNNDTLVTKGWLGKLIRHLDADPDIGLVGPVTNSIGNEAKIETHYRTLDEMDAFAERYAAAHAGETFDIRVAAMFCAAMRRKVYDEVGPLDEQFGVGMFEDDYAVRLRQRGYRLVCAEDVFVHHYGNATFRQMPTRDHLELFEANRRKFEAKWGRPWEPHGYRASVAKPRKAGRLIRDKRKYGFLALPDWRSTGNEWHPAVEAYIKAFSPLDDVSLVLYVDPVLSYKLIVKSLEDFLHRHGRNAEHCPDIILMNDLLDERGLEQLFREVHAYIPTGEPGEATNRIRAMKSGCAIVEPASARSLRASLGELIVKESLLPSDPAAMKAAAGRVPDPQADAPVCILGMHRSGTSLVARLLNLCGLYLGEEEDLGAPGPDNPDGFWEHRSFVELNDNILALFDGAWDHPPAFPEGWWSDERLGPLRQAAREWGAILASHGRWGWKDPRTSLTLPFWLTVFPDLKVVACVRDPGAVFHSLHARNGMSRQHALSLYREYNLGILHHTRPGRRVVTHYDSFFQTPPG